MAGDIAKITWKGGCTIMFLLRRRKYLNGCCDSRYAHLALHVIYEPHQCSSQVRTGTIHPHFKLLIQTVQIAQSVFWYVILNRQY